MKKNDEYQALTHQIEQTEADISTLEEREIELMLDIDTAKQEFEAEKAVIEVRIEAQRQEIALLTEREGNLNASVAAARAEVAESRVGVDADYLEQYDRVKKWSNVRRICHQLRRISAAVAICEFPMRSLAARKMPVSRISAINAHAWFTLKRRFDLHNRVKILLQPVARHFVIHGLHVVELCCYFSIEAKGRCGCALDLSTCAYCAGASAVVERIVPMCWMPSSGCCLTGRWMQRIVR